MNTTRKGSGHEHDHSTLASSRPEPAGQSCCGPTTAAGGPRMFGIPDHGDRSRASRIAAELAAQARLQAGTARSYLYAELDGKKS